MVQQSYTHQLSVSSFSSVLLGAIIAAAIAISFSALSFALGFGTIDVYSDNPLAGIATAVGIPSVIGIALGIAVGAFVAGRLAGGAGYSHGLATWASLLILAVSAGAIAASGAVRTTGNVAGAVITSAGSAVGGVAQGAGSAIGGGMSALNTDVLGDIDWNAKSQEIQQTLRNTRIDGLQPEQIEEAFKAAAQDIKDAARSIAINPAKIDEILSNLSNKLTERAASSTAEFDRNDAVTALVNNGWQQSEAEQAVDNAKRLIDQSRDAAQQGIERAKQTVAQIQQASEDLKNKSREVADAAAAAASTAAWWTFIAALVGALVSAFAGRAGVRSRTKLDIAL